MEFLKRRWTQVAIVLLLVVAVFGLGRLWQGPGVLQEFGTACGSPTSVRQAAATIDLNDHSFTPPIVEVKPGQVVRWVNKSGQMRQLVANPDKNYGITCSTLNSGKIAPGQEFYFVFNRTGTWPFYDSSNHNSAGQVMVR